MKPAQLISGLVLALGALSVVEAARGVAANDLCGDCTLAVRALKDLMCDPAIEGTVEDWLIDNVCASTGDNKQQCADIVNGVAPALFDWLRLGTDAQEMCSEAGVCATPKLFAAAPARRDPPRRVHGSGRNDMTCPLCVFVVSKVKESLSDPATREAVHDKTHQACGVLPEGGMRDTCTEWADQYEETIFKFVDTMEAADLCAMVGSCSLADKLAAVRLPPLSKGAVTALAPLVRRVRAVPSNDQCVVCKDVVAQMHSALASPDLQAQIVDYAKAACASMGSFADTCKEHVDQYAPMAFGMILTYLQPDQVCRQLKMCPPPSLAAKLFSSRVGGALLLHGAPEDRPLLART